jgi:Ca2+-transporting ATPase
MVAAPPASAWSILLDQFRSVVVALLVAAAVIASLLGDPAEAVAIASVLLLNAGIGFTVEIRARRAMEALLAYESASATVLREGEPQRIPASRLVPGDVIEVGEGDSVPADARVLDSWSLRVSEAPLTGEFAPVLKSAAPSPEDAALADRSSLLFLGTGVAAGRARAVVVATGSRTEVGQVGELVAGLSDEPTPLEVRLDALGRRLVWITLALATVVGGVGAARGLPWREMLETAVALAIASVPEGLPAVATIALAVGLRRMARRNALVRTLSAVEGLGSTTVVCTDKTGTLTSGQMTVVRLVGADWSATVSGVGFWEEGRIELDPDGADTSHVDPAAGSGGSGGEGSADTVKAAARTALLSAHATLNTGTEEALGDPTDLALLVMGGKAGLDRGALDVECPEVETIPFSADRPLTASVRRDGDGARVLHLKGAPPEVLGRCTRLLLRRGEVELTPEHQERLKGTNRALAAEGLRVIALARRDLDPAASTSPEGTDGELQRLTFLGFAAISDPPAPGVRETVARLQEAGIRTVMITGDQPATASAIAEGLGIASRGRRPGGDAGAREGLGTKGAGGALLQGRELRDLPDEELAHRVRDTAVFARTSPADKLRIVRALRTQGEVVAMLGDGANDAPALKQADVGVAMGKRGTDAARETADIILQDDRFPTVAAAVEEGRVIFENIRKFVFYLFSCNLAEVLVVLIAGLVALPLPLLPLQILWLNLVTDTFPALSLALEPGDPEIMARPPRSARAELLTRRFATAVGFHAAVITGVTLAAYTVSLRGAPVEEARTVAFMTLALAQLFHLGTARRRRAVLSPEAALANPWSLGAVVLVLALQAAAVYVAPLQRVLGTTALGWESWSLVVPLSLVPALVGQGIRLARHR